MSWEHVTRKAVCNACGHEGECITSSDDWNRSSTRWVGFGEVSPSDMDIYRHRYDADDRIPVCACGSRSIQVGDVIRER